MASSLEEEEYIDYSCSTPLERLARDVETQLRRWHVADTDRHVTAQQQQQQQEHQQPQHHHQQQQQHLSQLKPLGKASRSFSESNLQCPSLLTGPGGGTGAISLAPSSSSARGRDAFRVGDVGGGIGGVGSFGVGVGVSGRPPPSPTPSLSFGGGGRIGSPRRRSAGSSDSRTTCSTPPASPRVSEQYRRSSFSTTPPGSPGGSVLRRSLSLTAGGSLGSPGIGIGNPRLLRRCIVTFQSRGRPPLNLSLTLWDGPPLEIGLDRPFFSDGGVGGDFSGRDSAESSPSSSPTRRRNSQCAPKPPAVPLSIRHGSSPITPFPFSPRSRSPSSFFSSPATDLSRLFGIGQHITMCPHEGGEDREDIYGSATASGASSSSSSSGSWDEDALTTSFHAVRTALHVAAANARCRIPVFALMGHYDPTNEAKLTLNEKGTKKKKLTTKMRVTKKMKKNGFGNDESRVNASAMQDGVSGGGGRIGSMPGWIIMGNVPRMVPPSDFCTNVGGGGNSGGARFAGVFRSSRRNRRSGADGHWCNDGKSVLLGGGGGGWRINVGRLSTVVGCCPPGPAMDAPGATLLLEYAWYRGGGGRLDFVGGRKRATMTKRTGCGGDVLPHEGLGSLEDVIDLFRRLCNLGRRYSFRRRRRRKMFLGDGTFVGVGGGGGGGGFGEHDVVVRGIRQSYEWHKRPPDRRAEKGGTSGGGLQLVRNFLFQDSSSDEDEYYYGDEDKGAGYGGVGDGTSSQNGGSKRNVVVSAVAWREWIWAVKRDEVDDVYVKMWEVLLRRMVATYERVADARSSFPATPAALTRRTMNGDRKKQIKSDGEASPSVEDITLPIVLLTPAAASRRGEYGDDQMVDSLNGNEGDELGGGKVETTAGSRSGKDYLWGPTGDPVDHLRMTQHLSGPTAPPEEEDDGDLNQPPPPLPPTSVSVSCRDDTSEDVVPCPLSAHLRCVFAAYVHTSSLHRDVLMHRFVYGHDSTASGGDNAFAMATSFVGVKGYYREHVGRRTANLVEAMVEAAEDAAANGRYADEIEEEETVQDMVQDIRNVMQYGALWWSSANIPGGKVVDGNDHSTASKTMAAAALSALPHSAPLGGLMSLLCFQMMMTHNVVKSPASMCRYWLLFVEEMRDYWHRGSVVTNLGREFRPPPFVVTALSGAGGNVGGVLSSFENFLAGGKKRGRSGVTCASASAILAGDVDRSCCLLEQKLQLINLGIESAAAHGNSAVNIPATVTTIKSGVDGVDAERGLDQVDDDDNECGNADAGEDVDDEGGSEYSVQRTEGGGKRSKSKADAPGSAASSTTTNSHSPAKSQEHNYQDEHSTLGSIGEDDTFGSSDMRFGGSCGIGRPGRVRRGSYQLPRVPSSRASSGSTLGEEFYDTADEAGSSTLDGAGIFAAGYGNDNFGQASSLRAGARCPVHNLHLSSNGDLIYEPYLQPAMPLTTDVLMQRRVMMARQGRQWRKQRQREQEQRQQQRQRQQLQHLGRGGGSLAKNATLSTHPPFSAASAGFEGIVGGGGGSSSAVQSRLQIAHHYQRPMLLSDMQAFKAANPGAVLEDFVAWYGNPTNPLDEYGGTGSGTGGSGRSGSGGEDHDLLAAYGEEILGSLSPRTKDFCDNEDDAFNTRISALEAIEILNSTREFWAATWNDAEPITASQQRQKLFDPVQEVEAALQYLENLHPSQVLNHVLAVNFATAAHLLTVCAEAARKVRAVDLCLKRLRDKTRDALRRLMVEYHRSALSMEDIADGDEGSGGAIHSISPDTLVACEVVCNCIGEVELVLSKALSLLHKFPGQYELVQDLLRKKDGEEVHVKTTQKKSFDAKFLHLVKDQQQNFSSSNGMGSAILRFPRPTLREYCVRNTDQENPCQLFAQLVDQGERERRHFVLLALKKCARV